MATVELPTLTDGTPHYSFRTQLDGTDYLFTFRFGERRGGWVFDMETLDGVSILSGQLVTCFRDYLRRVSSDSRPPGHLWCANVSPPSATDGGALALPGLYDLGGPNGRARIYYVESGTEIGQ